ncbi:NAD(P)-dependent dehydrogenase, short-chain alcohol dehydrogenase family [Flavobacterium segetis]|uniref:NAD(P)-dependent dehydrogenase, short-chain alcohol dehydrogenase family n=1 Tax=Flavobacterium segetis TaxID=271157 RepID=A0A1M5IFJ7_9FLAO|nr:oxidoreductase [Flavobacterium segetis]SHG27154.1 NAD(P)-dependent dehydrogenase, short-chain alcohol dehydrogenase family [Flavobacterium segetis]
MFSIKDKVIVITGGNGLLGKQMVSTFREQGAIVIAADLFFETQSEDDFILDITDEDSVKNGVATIVEKYRRIDGWVNNAYPRTKDWGNKFENISLESWRSNVDMHLNGYFLCCQVVLEKMKIQGFGSLINMSSIYGLVGPDFTVYEGTEMTTPAAYSAIKGGLNNLSRYLASYYGAHQVRVNTVSPGGIFDNQPESFVSNYNKKVPMKRMGAPKDIVSAVFYLLTDEASYVTGHNLLVDGGWSII